MDILSKLPLDLVNKIADTHQSNIDNQYEKVIQSLEDIDDLLTHQGMVTRQGGYVYKYLTSIKYYLDFLDKFGYFVELQTNKKEQYEEQIKSIRELLKVDIYTKIMEFMSLFDFTDPDIDVHVQCIDHYIFAPDLMTRDIASFMFDEVKVVLTKLRHQIAYLLNHPSTIINKFITKNKNDKLAYLIKNITQKLIDGFYNIENTDLEEFITTPQLDEGESDEEPQHTGNYAFVDN